LSKAEGAEDIIQRTAKITSGVGVLVSFLPMPVLDLAAVGGLQWKMVNDLARHNGMALKGNRGKAVVGAALGALLPLRLGQGGIGYAVSSLPGGSILSLATIPAFNYASTVALGRVFHKHFASGGSFLDFDTDSMKDELMSEYRKAVDRNKTARAS